MTNEFKRDAIRLTLEGLAQNGRLQPRAVVEAARDPESVLHEYFTWDDVEAAEAHRLNQARALIRSVHVTIIDDRRILQTVAYVRDPDADGDEQGYVRTVTLKADKEKARAALAAEADRAAAYLARMRLLAVALDLETEVVAIEERLGTLREKVTTPTD